LLGAEWARISRFLADRALVAERRGTRRAIREQAIIATAAYAGLRRQEIADLRCGDLCLRNDDPYIVVRRGKGQKHREVVISPRLRRVLKNYLRSKARWGEPVEPSSMLFLSQRGPYTGSGIARIFRKTCARAGVRVLNIHALRHFFGSNLYASTKDLRLVQKQLGHSRITTTQVYIDLDDSDALQGMQAFDDRVNDKARENGAKQHGKRLEGATVGIDRI
jgi:integrase